MRANKLDKTTSLYDFTVLDILENVMVKIYQGTDGFSFRFVSFQNNAEIDPVTFSNKDNWAYGPYNSPNEAFLKAKELYKLKKVK